MTSRNFGTRSNFLNRNNRLTIYAYVLMDNHIHLIVSSDNLNKEVANFKSYSARKCINYYIEQNDRCMLEQFALNKPVYRKDRSYRFWQEGIHPNRIQGEKMMRQKIDYIHQNPVRKGFVDSPEDWIFSSAVNYSGVVGLIDVCVDW